MLDYSNNHIIKIKGYLYLHHSNTTKFSHVSNQGNMIRGKLQPSKSGRIENYFSKTAIKYAHFCMHNLDKTSISQKRGGRVSKKSTSHGWRSVCQRHWDLKRHRELSKLVYCSNCGDGDQEANTTPHKHNLLIHTILNIQNKTNKKGLEFSCAFPVFLPCRS